jgi:hypothetical protein
MHQRHYCPLITMSLLSIVFSHSKDFEDNNVTYKIRITTKLLNKINSNLCTCQFFLTIRLFCKFPSNLDFLQNFAIEFDFFSILSRQFIWLIIAWYVGQVRLYFFQDAANVKWDWMIIWLFFLFVLHHYYTQLEHARKVITTSLPCQH